MTQIAVKIPDQLLALIDELVARGTVPNRSAAVRKGLEVLIAGHERRDVDRLFREGFGRAPETDDELADARRLAIESIHDEVWEKWW